MAIPDRSPAKPGKAEESPLAELRPWRTGTPVAVADASHHRTFVYIRGVGGGVSSGFSTPWKRDVLRRSWKPFTFEMQMTNEKLTLDNPKPLL